MNAPRATLISLLLSTLCSAQLPEIDAKPEPRELVKAVLSIPRAVEEQPFVWGKVTQWYAPCGRGVRPYLLWGNPYIGSTFRVVYHLFSLPREDGVYSTPGSWVVLSTMPPRNYEEPVAVFPNGCVLLWDVASPWVFVWGFSGTDRYQDTVMKREQNGRTAVLSVALPNDYSLRGATLWTQLITLEDEVKTSQLVQVTVGQPVSDLNR